MASLLQLVEALVSDPEAKADYGRDPDGYLSQRGFGDLDANDVTEALGHAADSFPPALASQVQPDDGFAALTSIELDDLGMSGVEDYSSSAPTPTDSGPFSDWDDDGVKEWNSSPDIADWELDPPATAAAEVLEPSQDVDDDLQFAPNEPSHVSPTSHLFADPSELDTPLALDQADAAATAPDVATAETLTTTEEVVEHEVSNTRLSNTRLSNTRLSNTSHCWSSRSTLSRARLSCPLMTRGCQTRRKPTIPLPTTSPTIGTTTSTATSSATRSASSPPTPPCR